MLDLYFWPTPNGYKVSILLEELEVPYRVVPVHIGKGAQFEPGYLAINPNGKIPALVDMEGPGGAPISIFESGAIMMYLAEMNGFRFMPSEVRSRYAVVQWLMFQMAGIGPMLGQAHHFRNYAPEKIDYAIRRYTSEAGRLYSIVDRRLGESEFLAGPEYSIADMAVYPWLRAHKLQGQKVDEFPNLQRWYNRLRARPGVQRGISVLSEKVPPPDKRRPEGERWDTLFGEKQYARR
ncbi:MAG: glutathione S-transferase N-terminal domain-containing protein [Lautropia sp.]